MSPKRRYNPAVALVLAIFLGFLGIDRFYTGNVLAGLIKLLTLGGFTIWWVIDIVIFAVEAVKKAGQEKQAHPGQWESGSLAADRGRPGPARAFGSVRETPAQPHGNLGQRGRDSKGSRHLPPRPRGEAISAWSRASTMTEVVGEYYVPESYEQIFAGMPKDGSFSSFERTAALYPDPYNPHSSGDAVTVWINGHHAGYLASGNASRYAARLKSMAERGQYLTVRAMIAGRFDHRRSRWAAEARIELPEPSLVLPVNDLPVSEHVLIPAGRTIQVTEESRHMDVLALLTGDGDVPYAATLHAIHEVRPRSSFEAVEVRINGDAVGVLSKATSEKILPLVQLIERRGLVAVARAKVSGNSLGAEVTLNMIRSSEAEPGWIEEIEKRPLAPRIAEGPDDDWDS